MPQIDELYIDSAITIYAKYRNKLLILVGIGIIISILGIMLSNMWIGLIAFVCFSVSIPAIIAGRKTERDIKRAGSSKGSRKTLKKIMEKKLEKLNVNNK